MATKTPSKGKKPSAKDGVAPPSKKPRGAKAKAAPVEPEEGDEELDGDEDDEDEVVPAKAVARKPAQAAGGKPAGEAAPMVPARRLTPEAKAKVNEMVAKGMSLSDALKAAAAWETFVAPVRDEPAKLVQGKSFEGRPGPKRRAPSEDDEPPELDGDDEDPAGAIEAED